MSSSENTQQTFRIPSLKQKEYLGTALTAYADQLSRDESALDYLTSQRNLSAAKLQYFNLGFVADPLPGHEMFKGRIAIPYKTRAGVVGFKFRALSPDAKAKYLYPTGQQHSIFNPEAFFSPKPHIAICEGEIDAMTAHSQLLPAVGMPGVSSQKPWFTRPFQGYETIYVLADTDDKNGEGLAFAEDLASKLQNVRIIPMPTGHDVNSYVSAEGYESLIERIGL